MKKFLLIAAIGMMFSNLTYSQNSYTLDKYHARLSFSVLHMGISFVDGNFKDFDAKLVSSKEDFTDAQIELTADVKSINTEVEMRDNDLREKWFEVAKYPALTFKSTSLAKVNGNQYKLSGNITLHGVTKPIVFDVVYNGKAQSPFSKKYSYGFTITGKLNRSDFGVGAEAVATVANEVALRSNVEFVAN
jgi:polyisoprenoid-binding protein YceI